jgi:hypothetical protein
MAQISIVAQQGSHLLLQRRGRLAIVERRDGMIYGVGSEDREGFPDTPEGLASAVGHDAWGDSATVRAQFEEITERGEALANKTW